jgi:sulfoxide reductase heme-binding subunit YedZ
VNDPTLWIAARTTGMVAYGLMALTMLMGLTLAGRARPSWAKPGDVVTLHRSLSFTALVLVAVHGVALVLDSAVDIPVAGLVVPGLVPYRPFWTALGVTAAWLAVAVHLSFDARRRIGARWWRRLHFATYGVFALATAHGLAAGTDSGRAWALAVYGGAVGLVAAATVWRAGVERSGRRAATAASGTTARARGAA